MHVIGLITTDDVEGMSGVHVCVVRVRDNIQLLLDCAKGR